MRMILDFICKVGFGVEIGILVFELLENFFVWVFDIVNIIVIFRFIDFLWKIKKFLNVGLEVLFNESIKIIDDFIYLVIWRRKVEIEDVKRDCNNIKVMLDNIRI